MATVAKKEDKVITWYGDKKAGFSFSITLRDVHGKPIPVLDNGGNVKYIDGMPVYQERTINFRQGNPLLKYGRYCQLSSDDIQLTLGANLNNPTREAIIRRLNELVKDGSSCVVDERTFKIKRNAKAVELEDNLNATKLAHEKLEEENIRLRNQIENMKNPMKVDSVVSK